MSAAASVQGEAQLPTEADFAYLDTLGLDLSKPLRQAVALLQTGRGTNDPEVSGSLLSALAQYDEDRIEFDRRAALIADPEGRADSWRACFESIRELYP